MSQFSEWAAHQLEMAGYIPRLGGDVQIVHTSVMRVCREFGEINMPALSPPAREEVVRLLTELLNSRALPIAADSTRWVPSRQLPPAVGSTVRIPHNRYTGEEGMQLNGRVAQVVGARRGQFVIKFLDTRAPDEARLLAADLETRA
jgi:hypothetical protein